MNRALQIDFILSIPTIKNYKINTNTNLILLDQGNDVPESIKRGGKNYLFNIFLF